MSDDFQPEEPSAYSAEDTFGVQIEAVQEDLKKKISLDFNELPRSGKQAVLALVDEQRARLVTTSTGRLEVVHRGGGPSLMRYLTLGAFG